MTDPAVTRAIKKMGSAAKLAAAIGITRSAVSQWQHIPGQHIAKVLEATGFTPNELFGSDEPQQAAE